MALDLVGLLSTTVALLSRYNVTGGTFDITSSLQKKVQAFYVGTQGMHEGCPIPLEIYPVVFVELGSVHEEMRRLGNSPNRDVEIDLHIVAVTNYGAGVSGEARGREKANTECIDLCNNIQYLIRNKVTLSGTVQMCTVENVSFSGGKEGIYNCVGDVALKVLITDTA
jgi:hypothetical protein